MAVQINVAANQAALTASIQAGVQAYNQRFAQNNQLNLTVNQRAFSQPLVRVRASFVLCKVSSAFKP